MGKVLALKGLSKRFGSVQANEAIDLDLNKGEVLALLGENGSGKTTLMNMLFGHYLPDTGSIEVADTQGTLQPLALGHPQISLTKGIGMVHQHFTLAENLNALDNITLGTEPLISFRRNTRTARIKLEKIMQDTGLFAPLDIAVGKLSVGERQRIEILKALYRDVRILVLDEPTAVLTPQEADDLFDNINTMAKSGLSVIFISHKLREVLSFSQRIVVLRQGKKVGELVTNETNESEIAHLMVGGGVKNAERETCTPGEAVLQLNKVSISGRSKRDSLLDQSLEARAHEILGIAGVSGNGQAALASLIAGLEIPENGSILIDGSVIEKPTPKKMIGAGVGRIPEDRHHEGIIGKMNLADNLIIEKLDDQEIQNFGILKQSTIKSNAAHLCETYDVRGPGVDAEARLFSGGNIQKMILARVFEQNPKLILANQPTRGLDMGASAEVRRRLLDARKKGAAILLISEDLDEVLALSDRILVMHDGNLIPAETRDRAQIGLLMAGTAA
ncbi:MAG: ABC transporter ATP-binding protein [Paracoccaceae bacterium]